MKQFWMGLALAAGSMAVAQAEGLREETRRLMADVRVEGPRAGASKGLPSRAGAKHALANIVENAILRASNAAAFDEFGSAVAVDGNTVVVGAYRNDEFPLQSGYTSETQEDGAVYVYVRSGDSWSQQQRLVPSDHAPNDQFGFAVAIQGDTLVVGSPQADGSGANVDRGAVYVFTRSAGVWTQQAKLTGSGSAGGSRFGTAVAIDNGTIVATAPREDEVDVLNTGAAYVFVGAGASWTQQQRLIDPFGLQDDALGNDVDLQGDVLVVGAQFADDEVLEDAGAAYVFTRAEGIWSLPARLESTVQAEMAHFGRSVALHGGRVAVSDHLRDVGEGAVVIFAGAEATWTAEQTIVASDGAALDFFGHSLSLRGDVLLVGAYNADLGSNVDRGAAYRFERVLGTWQEVDKYVTSDHALNDRVAFDVDLGQSNAVVGAPFFRMLDLPPLMGREEDARPLAAARPRPK